MYSTVRFDTHGATCAQEPHEQYLAICPLYHYCRLWTVGALRRAAHVSAKTDMS